MHSSCQTTATSTHSNEIQTASCSSAFTDDATNASDTNVVIAAIQRSIEAAKQGKRRGMDAGLWKDELSPHQRETVINAHLSTRVATKSFSLKPAVSMFYITLDLFTTSFCNITLRHCFVRSLCDIV